MTPRHIALAAALLATLAAGAGLQSLIARLRAAPDASTSAGAPRATPEPATTVATSEPAPQRDAPVAAAPTSVRAQIRAAIERDVRPLSGRERVERYLDQLEQQARANGRVTALEVEPGIAAIQGLSGELAPAAVAERTAVFSERMRRLSAQLDGRATDAPAAAAPDIETLAAQVERASDAETREAAIHQYLAGANELDPAAQLLAMDRLNRLVQRDRAASP